MYAYIKGTLEETGEDYIVVEAGGICLECAGSVRRAHLRSSLS